MKVGFVGVGLIGGSMLKRLCKCGVECFIFDKNQTVMDVALKENDAKILNDFCEVDLLLLSLSPDASIDFIEKNHPKIGTKLIADVCGVKNCILNVAKKYNLNYCGLHPMAGREVGGYFNSKDNLFDGANIVVTTQNPPEIITKIISMLGFSKVVFSDSDLHDKIISYTSQLCHIVSNAYAKNPYAKVCDGFTGGSFEDLTRVGKMDSNLWVELFRQNKNNLENDINNIIYELQKYANCLHNNDYDSLKTLIEEGNEILTNKPKSNKK